MCVLSCHQKHCLSLMQVILQAYWFFSMFNPLVSFVT
jgi:hypothetical protein